MTMPQMTGDKLAAEVLKLKPNLPIITMTGYSKRVIDDSLVRRGIKGYLHKHINKGELALMVHQVLDDARTPDAAEVSINQTRRP